MPWLKSYHALRWTLLGAVAAHNLEEWFTFPSTLLRATETLSRFGVSLGDDPWETMQLALVLATIIPAMIIFYAASGQQRPFKDFLVCSLAGIFFANAFFPHLILAIINKGYAPGVASAALIVFPITIALWRAAFKERILTLKQIYLAALVGAIALFPSVLAISVLADRILQFTL